MQSPKKDRTPSLDDSTISVMRSDFSDTTPPNRQSKNFRTDKQIRPIQNSILQKQRACLQSDKAILHAQTALGLVPLIRRGASRVLASYTSRFLTLPYLLRRPPLDWIERIEKHKRKGKVRKSGGQRTRANEASTV